MEVYTEEARALVATQLKDIAYIEVAEVVFVLSGEKADHSLQQVQEICNG
jgi:hypothetical protein